MALPITATFAGLLALWLLFLAGTVIRDHPSVTMPTAPTYNDACRHLQRAVSWPISPNATACAITAWAATIRKGMLRPIH